MALRPTGPRVPQDNERALVSRPAQRPAISRPSPASPARAAPVDPVRARTRQGFRLRTAVTEEEIDAQIQRLMLLIANDNIDPDAPAGSYLNLLV
jgi:hypothetical protein